jgi:outer membrane receptor protein involved in Fe transport
MGQPLLSGFRLPTTLLVMALWALPIPAAAAEAPKHLSLEEIVVVDSALSDPQATVIGTKTIEKGRNINIPDVLKNEADIGVSRRAAVGDTTDILSIRGLSANRIMLTINGRPVNAAGVVGGYYIDWGTIPLDNIEKLEIIRGGSSVEYGNNALGGVVNVVTKKPTEKPVTTLFSSYGGGSEVDYIQNYRLTNSWKIGPVGYTISGSYQKAAPFLWNDDFEGKNASANIYLDTPFDGELFLGIQYSNSRRGFIRQNRVSTDPNSSGFFTVRTTDYPLAFGETIAPGWGNAFIPGPGAYWDKTKYYFDVGFKQPIGDALIELKAYKNHEDRHEKNYSSNATVPTYPDGLLVLDRNVESDRSFGGSAKALVPLGNHDILVGVDYKVQAFGDIVVNFVDTAYNGKPYAGGPSSHRGTSWGFYGQDTWEVSDRFTLTAGLRYDTYNNEPQHGTVMEALKDGDFSPKLTGTCRVTEADTLTVSLYQALRTPGLPETYWWYNGKTAGNPELKPEKNNAAELAWQHRFTQKHLVKVSGYYYSIDDFIVFRNDPNWRGVYNMDKAEIAGASVEGKSEILSWLTGSATVSYLHTGKKGDPYDTSGLTDRLDYSPEWKGSVGLDVKLPYHAVLSAALRYVGDQETVYAYTASGKQRFSLQRLGSFITADAELKIPVTKYGDMSLYAENILDKHYQERFGFPLTGRIIGGALKITF